MSRALDGLRVVDLSNTLSGTQTSQLFADFGAEVVHVEPPGGSPLRTQPAWPFWARGKKSIELDLRDANDRDVAYGLSCDADVLVETFRPGVADRLGLGYEQLSSDNPGLVYGSITAFGRDNALSHLKGYEGVVMAKIGGYATLSNLAARPGPAFGTVEYCSASVAHTLAQGILAALYEREDSSLGQRVESTLVQALGAHDTWNWIVRMIAKKYFDAFTSQPRVDEARNVPNSPLAYRLLVGLSKDGRWLQFSQTSERLWVAFMRSLGLEWMLTDPKWKDAPSSDDIDLRREFWETMINAVRAKTVAEWNQAFDDDPDVFAEIFRHGTELLHHPQTIHNRQVITVTDPVLGDVTQPGPLVRMDATPASIECSAPALDEHGAELRGRARRKRAPRSAHDTNRAATRGRDHRRARNVLRRSVRHDDPHRLRRARHQDRTARRRPDALDHAVPRSRRHQGVAGQGERRRRHGERRGTRDRLRARPPGRRGAPVVPRRRGGSTRIRRQDIARVESRPRLPQRAGLRRRRPLRTPSGVCTHDRRRHRAGPTQHR